ncbi:hypothetical protein UPYG_G00049600 [Umbra pygmaea]|uniref:Serine/threonine-protein kinase haspin n=1 Tax=Umbra pygmaea TaxID=75934 RepID=A0ABD0YFH7_UMBPY
MSRPVFLKTYGKMNRKVNPWISPDNRKLAFASTSSSDVSVVAQPTGPKSSGKRVRKRSTAASRRPKRLAKTKALTRLKDDSDQENVAISPLPQTSPSPGVLSQRFVTHRKGGKATLKHKPPKRRDYVLLAPVNSSNEFVQDGGGVAKRAFRFRAKREPGWALVSSDSSLADPGNSSITIGNGLLHEISLNGPSMLCLGTSHRKPLFSSTPSSRFRKRPPPPIRPSVSSSASDILVISSTQEDVDVPPSPCPSGLVADLHPGPALSGSLRHPQGQPEVGSCEKQTHNGSPLVRRNWSRSGASEIKDGVDEQLSPVLFASDACERTGPVMAEENTEDGSLFVSASMGQYWLAEAKARCLELGCVVRLERMDKLHQETTSYSSCFDHTDFTDGTQPRNQGGFHNTRSVNQGGVDNTRSVNNGQYIDHMVSSDQSSVYIASCNPTRLTNEGQAPGSAVKTGQSLVFSLASSEQPFSLEDRVKQRCLDVGCMIQLQRLNAARSHTDMASSSRGDPRSDSDPCDKTSSSDNHNLCLGSGGSNELVRTAGAARKKLLGKGFPRKRKAGGVAKERTLSVSKEGRGHAESGKRSRTSRKACVSGVSVSRWSRRDQAAPPPGRPGDCSIAELLVAQHPQKVLGDSVIMLGTPVQRSKLSFSFLDNLSPDTHTWSRLKAALSVHRKIKAILTPKRLPLDRLSSPGAGLRAALADVSMDLFATPLRTPLPKNLCSQIWRSSPLSVCQVAEELSDAEKVYSECGQTAPLGFQDCIPPEKMLPLRKVGEGTFGEVFCTTNKAGEKVALKIIPIEGAERVNGEEQKTFGEILHEIIISKELSSLNDNKHNRTTGFIGLKDLHCVQGCYPPDLLLAWDHFNNERGSENDRPDFFSKDQVFLILEFEFGGSDLENSDGQLSSLNVAKSVLHQVIAALAVAEQELQFEHRDLHWGNVLVQPTVENQSSFLLNGVKHFVQTRGITVKIIDYSLSRLEIDELTVSCDLSEDDLLFEGQGDYQFEIYRIMRKENSNVWSEYHPHSNVLWLHYLCDKLLSMTYEKHSARGIKQTRKDLQHFFNHVLSCSSAVEVMENLSHLLS